MSNCMILLTFTPKGVFQYLIPQWKDFKNTYLKENQSWFSVKLINIINCKLFYNKSFPVLTSSHIFVNDHLVK